MKFISYQESAASTISGLLFLAEDPDNGLGSRALMALERAGLSGAADSLTLEEIAALQRDYPSDDTASTVSIDQEESSVPTWTPAAAIASDPIYGFADPIIVSDAVSEPNSDIPDPIDNLVRREKERKAKLSTLKILSLKFIAWTFSISGSNFLSFVGT